ncbi:MAG: hypothetical protein AAFW59_05435 [Pseudomonadota bacterium]
MSELIRDKLAAGEARLVAEPKAGPRHQVEVDQNFGLPSALYGVTVACYLGFLAIMLASFAAPMLAIPMVIFAGFIVAGFGVPMIWTRLGKNTTKPMSYGQFQNDGVMTHTGRCAPRDAAIQMLILPGLIVAWGCAVAIIVAIVT